MQEAGTLFLMKNKCWRLCGPFELKKQTPHSYKFVAAILNIQLKPREGSLETEYIFRLLLEVVNNFRMDFPELSDPFDFQPKFPDFLAKW